MGREVGKGVHWVVDVVELKFEMEEATGDLKAQTEAARREVGECWRWEGVEDLSWLQVAAEAHLACVSLHVP